MIDLGYPFTEEGNTFVIQKALGQDNIDELLALSEEYGQSDEDSPIQYGISQIPFNEEGDTFSPGNNRVSSKRHWANQVLISGVLGLNNNGQQQYTEPTSTDGQNAWTNPKTLLQDDNANAELFNIHSAEYYQDQTGSHKITLLCPSTPRAPNENANLVKIRWL
jgi:hypothetical protein